MSKRQVIMVIGAIMIIFPFLGFPASWQKVIVVLCGIIIVAISYMMAPKVKSEGLTANMPFSEHKSTNSAAPHTRPSTIDQPMETSSAGNINSDSSNIPK